MSTASESNSSRHYILLTVAVIIGMVGVYLRFAGFRHDSVVSNIILVVAVIIALKAVFDILK
jgi:hypothetical protein